MKSATGFVIPDGCGLPDRCHPEYQTYERKLGWSCVMCRKCVRPQPETTSTFTFTELNALRALALLFSDVGFGTCWRDDAVIGCKLEGVDNQN